MLFAPLPTLLSGAFAGFLFGFLLRKAHVTRFNVIVSQLLLRDFTVLKVIMTAIVVGSVGIYGMHGLGLIEAPALSTSSLQAVGLGGLIFGVGMATLGYCPGTGIAALGDGSRDMIFGLIGMLTGAALYAEAYPWLSKKLTLTTKHTPTLFSLAKTSPWMMIGALAIFALLLFFFLESPRIKTRAHA